MTRRSTCTVRYVEQSIATSFDRLLQIVTCVQQGAGRNGNRAFWRIFQWVADRRRGLNDIHHVYNSPPMNPSALPCAVATPPKVAPHRHGNTCVVATLTSVVERCAGAAAMADVQNHRRTQNLALRTTSTFRRTRTSLALLTNSQNTTSPTATRSSTAASGAAVAATPASYAMICSAGCARGDALPRRGSPRCGMRM